MWRASLCDRGFPPQWLNLATRQASSALFAGSKPLARPSGICSRSMSREPELTAVMNEHLAESSESVKLSANTHAFFAWLYALSPASIASCT
jgi:hypothetical protein